MSSTVTRAKLQNILRATHRRAAVVDDVPEFPTLRHITRALDTGGAERHRKQLRVLGVIVGLVGTLAAGYFWIYGLSVVKGVLTLRQTVTATGFRADYVWVPQSPGVLVFNFGFAALFTGVTVVGIWVNGVCRPVRHGLYEIESDAIMANWFWGASTLLLTVVCSLTAFISTDVPKNQLTETVNNWLVTTRHVSSDTNYAGSTTTHRDFLTRNVDGQWVYFTVTRGDGLVQVTLHDGPQGTAAR